MIRFCISKTGTEEEEEDGLKSKKTFRSQSVVAQSPEAELMLEGDDDAVSLLQEKEIDNLAGKSRKCNKIVDRLESLPEQDSAVDLYDSCF